MDQQELTVRDPDVFIGSSGRVSEVLNRKRPLSQLMIKRLYDGLNISYVNLLANTAYIS